MPFYAEKLFLAINRDWGAQVALTKKIRGSRVARVQEGVRLWWGYAPSQRKILEFSSKKMQRFYAF